VDEVEIDVEECGFACGFGDDMLFPDFFEECFGRIAHGVLKAELAGLAVFAELVVSFVRSFRW